MGRVVRPAEIVAHSSDRFVLINAVEVSFQRLYVLWDLPRALPVPWLSKIGFYFHERLDENS